MDKHGQEGASVATTLFSANNVHIPVGTSYVPNQNGTTVAADTLTFIIGSGSVAGTTQITYSVQWQDATAPGGWRDLGGASFFGGPWLTKAGQQTTAPRADPLQWPGGVGRVFVTSTAACTLDSVTITEG